jgi:hypothetical protein
MKRRKTVSYVRRFRDWCRENAPIVDFVSKVVIGIFGLVLTLIAMQLTRTQIEIQSKQAESQRQPHLPRFKFQLDRGLGDQSASFVVINEGGDVFDFEPDAIVFWWLEERDRERNRLVASASIAADPFLIFGKGPWSGWAPPTGEVARYYIYSKEWRTLIANLNRLTSETTWLVGDEFQIVVRLRYKDIFGDRWDRFFAVSIDTSETTQTTSSARLLSTDDGVRLYRNHEHQIGERKKMAEPNRIDVNAAWQKYKSAAE